MLSTRPNNTFFPTLDGPGLAAFTLVAAIHLRFIPAAYGKTRRPAAAMIRTACRSSEELAFLAPDSPSTPPELIPDDFNDDESEPGTPPSLESSSTFSVDSLKPSQLPIGIGVKLRLPDRNNRRQAAYIPKILPPIDRVLGDADVPHDRSHDSIRRHQNSGPVYMDSKSPVSLDRFVPPRDFAESPSTSFRVSKTPQKMSPDEKLLRRRLPKEDPFLPTRRRRATTAPEPHSGVHRLHNGPHLVNDSAIAGHSGTQGLGVGSRQVSIGGVWSVGGTSAAIKSSLAIPDGAGGLLSSGTTAPMHTAQFFPRHVSPEDPEKHESRIALALDIDRASRLLNTCQLSLPVNSTPSPSSPDYEKYSPFVWKNSAWIRTEGDQCESACSSNAPKRIPIYHIK